MWKGPWLLKINILVSPIQVFLHSQSMKEGPHLSSDCLRVITETGVDWGASRVSVAQI